MKMRVLTALLVLAPLSAAAEWTEDAELCATIIGDSPRAIRHCEAAIASGVLGTEDLSTTWSNLAYELGAMGRYVEALEASTTAIEIDPQHPRGWVNRGTYRQLLGQLEAAHDDFVHALDLIAKASEGFGEPTAGVGPFYGANLGLARINRRWERRDAGLPHAKTAYEMRPDGDPELFAWYGLR